jgi:hypothetical protein
MNLKAALEYAAAGHQALHLMNHSGGRYPNAPRCFRQTKEFGHLIDKDKKRLIKTVRRLGVQRIVVSREGREGQHVDLCGQPFKKAILECENANKNRSDSSTEVQSDEVRPNSDEAASETL